MGNIVGEPFKDYVKTQIKKRQEIHGKKTRDSTEISYLNSRTSWVKLVSGTQIEMERLNMLPSLSETQKQALTGLGLAEKFVLFNGTTSINQSWDEKKMQVARDAGMKMSTKLLEDARTGTKIKDTYSKFTPQQKSGFTGADGAYFSGIGNNKYEFGIVPMPGIESVDIKALERGSIRRATVTLKAYNKEQFDIIDILYLRLGYTLLLEWGDSHYIDNSSGEITKMGTTLLEKEFFKYRFATTYYELLDVLEKERKLHSGCYDALVGKISNFKWTFNPDGTYKIILDVISLGDVIESLKLNTAPYSKASKETLTEEEQDLIDSRREDNELAKMFYNIKTFAIKNITNETMKNTGMVLATSPAINAGFGGSNIIGLLLTYFSTDTVANNSSTENGITLSTFNQEENKRYDAIKVGRGIIIPPEYRNIYESIIGPRDNPKDQLEYGDASEYVQLGIENKKQQWYIRLGNLLESINQLLIHNLKTTTNQEYSELKIDTNSITNLMYYIPNMISLDPKICIITNTISKPDYFSDEAFRGLNPFKLNSKSGEFSYGRIMNIYMNMNYVLELLFETDKDGNILFMEFLRKMCDGINKSLGGVNRLEPKISPDNNILKIYDQTPIPGKTSLPPEIFPTSSIKDAQFNLYGYNTQDNTSNFIHNIGLTTEITPEYASMITVGATADGYVVGEEATAFSKWNTGIVDRFKESIGIQSSLNNTSSIAEKYNTIKINYYNLIKQSKDTKNVSNWYSYLGLNMTEDFTLGSTPANSATRVSGKIITGEEDVNFGLVPTKINEENIAANRNIAKEYYKYIQAVAVQSTSSLASSGQTGFLPFNLQLDMEGLSGMKLYQKLEVNSNFLPTNYPEKLEFITTNIDHTLSNNKWSTKISSIATVNNLISTRYLNNSLNGNLSSYIEQLRNEGKIDDKFTIKVKDYSTVVPPNSQTLNPIIISDASQVSKYMKLYGPNSTRKILPKGFDVIEGKYYKNFIIRKGDSKNSYAMQFIKYLGKKDSRIRVKGANDRKPGELGNGADISKRLYNTLIVLAQNALKEDINLVITAGNDSFHQGKTLKSGAKYPTSNVTPANTTHTRGIAIDVRTEGMSTKEINLRIKLLQKSGFGGILYHDPPHIHANINPNLPTQDR